MTTVTPGEDPMSVAGVVALPIAESWRQRHVLELDGASLAKGRNGYFKIAEASWWDLGLIGDDRPIHVAFRSKRSNNADPIQLNLTRADAEKLRAFLDVALRGNQEIVDDAL